MKPKNVVLAINAMIRSISTDTLFASTIFKFTGGDPIQDGVCRLINGDYSILKEMEGVASIYVKNNHEGTDGIILLLERNMSANQIVNGVFKAFANHESDERIELIDTVFSDANFIVHEPSAFYITYPSEPIHSTNGSLLYNIGITSVADNSIQENIDNGVYVKWNAQS